MVRFEWFSRFSPDTGGAGGGSTPHKESDFNGTLQNAQATYKAGQTELHRLNNQGAKASKELHEIRGKQQGTKEALTKEQQRAQGIQEYLDAVKEQVQEGIASEMFSKAIEFLNNYIEEEQIGKHYGQPLRQNRELKVSTPERGQLDTFVLNRIIRELASPKDPNLQKVLLDTASNLAGTLEEIIKKQNLPITTREQSQKETQPNQETGEQTKGTTESKKQATPTMTPEKIVAMHAVIDAFAGTGVQLEIDENGKFVIAQSEGKWDLLWSGVAWFVKGPIKTIYENLKDLQKQSAEIESSLKKQQQLQYTAENLQKMEKAVTAKLEQVKESVRAHLQTIKEMATLLQVEAQKHLKNPLIKAYEQLGVTPGKNFSILNPDDLSKAQQQARDNMLSNVQSIASNHEVTIPEDINADTDPLSLATLVQEKLKNQKRQQEAERLQIEKQLSDSAIQQKKEQLKKKHGVEKLDKDLQSLTQRIESLESGEIDETTLQEIKNAFTKLPELSPRDRSKITTMLAGIIDKASDENLAEFAESLQGNLKNDKRLRKLLQAPLFREVAKYLLNKQQSEANENAEAETQQAKISPTDNPVQFLLSLPQYKQVLQAQRASIEEQLSKAQQAIQQEIQTYMDSLQAKYEETNTEILRIDKSLTQIEQYIDAWQQIHALHKQIQEELQPIVKKFNQLYQGYEEIRRRAQKNLKGKKEKSNVTEQAEPAKK